MSLYLPHIRSLVEKVLQDFDPELNSKSAVNLILGTIAQESRFGTYLYQLGGGPAVGICQVEEFTFNDLKKRYSKKYQQLLKVQFQDLAHSLKWSIIFCRLKYRDNSEAIPYQNDIEGLAQYWKKYYNSYLGKGTVKEFIDNYNKYVATDTAN